MLMCKVSFAQLSPIEQAIEYLVEFGETESQDFDLVQFAEQLSYLETNPVSLNSATAEEMLEIPLLNSFMVFNFLEYRKRNGRILSYYQLADIKGFTPKIITLITPFTTLDYAKKTGFWPAEFNHQLAYRYRQILQENEGTKTNTYAGHASENYLRYRLQGSNRLFAGLTAQKDAGELWLTDTKTPDYFSFHLEYKINKTFKNVVLGDFSAEFGQGLILWSSLALNKNSESTNLQRFGRGLRHYTGTDENRFLRGGGTTLNFGNIDVALFASSNKVDANLSLDANGALVATSLSAAGLHRTANEMADKNSQTLQMQGANIIWKPTRFRLGATVLRTTFMHPILFADRPENILRFSGNELLHTGAHWAWLYGRMSFFGELGREWHTQSQAITTGIQIQAFDALQYVVQFRHISPKWFAPYSAPFSETGREGEQGFYIGLSWQLPKQIKINFFADHFQYLWLRNNLNKPGTGTDYMLQATRSDYTFGMYVRGRYQHKLANVSGISTIANTDFANRLSLRWHGTYTVTPATRLQLRVEWVDFSQDLAHENGILAFIGINQHIAEKWQIKARYILFDTKSYASAIWTFEDDLPYTFSVPANYNQGTRWYVVATYQPTQKIEIWLRLANTNYLNTTSIGSGYDAIMGNQRTEFKTMVRVSF